MFFYFWLDPDIHYLINLCVCGTDTKFSWINTLYTNFSTLIYISYLKSPKSICSLLNLNFLFKFDILFPLPLNKMVHGNASNYSMTGCKPQFKRQYLGRTRWQRNRWKRSTDASGIHCRCRGSHREPAEFWQEFLITGKENTEPRKTQWGWKKLRKKRRKVSAPRVEGAEVGVRSPHPGNQLGQKESMWLSKSEQLTQPIWMKWELHRQSIT